MALRRRVRRKHAALIGEADPGGFEGVAEGGDDGGARRASPLLEAQDRPAVHARSGRRASSDQPNAARAILHCTGCKKSLAMDNSP